MKRPIPPPFPSRPRDSFHRTGSTVLDHVLARGLLPTLFLAGLASRADSGNWTPDNAGNWSNGANWSSNPIVPGTAAGDTIGLNNNITANRTVTIDTTSRTAGTLLIGDSNSTHGFTLAASGGAGLSLDNGGLGALISKGVSTQSDTISAPLSVTDAAGLTITVNTGALSITGGLNNGGTTLTVDGAGTTSFNATANVISGAGGVVKNGTGTLILGGSGTTTPAHSYTGTTVINGGTVMVFGNGNKPAGNFMLNNGLLTDYFQQTTTFTGGLGNGNNQIQIFGNSGFGGGNGDSFWRIGASGSVLTWGSTHFNPTTLRFLSPADNLGPFTYGRVTLDNGIDLNGAARTIDVLAATGPSALSASSGRINGVISGAGGSLIKVGGGTLVLAGNNTYDGSTTISAGQLTANSSAALGNGSATNTLVFDGGMLRAGGAITSPSTRAVTVNSTATIDTNNFAVRIDGAITGAGGLTKNGAGTLTLAGANGYSGPTVVNAGSLSLSNQSALYNGNTANWTAANLNFKSGSTLALSVDSAGVAGFTQANLSTLLANLSVAGSASEGIQSGVQLALDTAAATGGTFTLGYPITDSTGAFGGRLSFTKQGAGILVLSQASGYTGSTAVSGGTLQLDPGATISTAPLHLNGGTLAVNQSGTFTQGANFPALIGGTGSLANIGAGTLVLNAPTFHTGNTSATAGSITLTHALAIQNSALDTSGSGSVTLNAIPAPVFGGLANSGTARDLASVIGPGYASVTGLTLNPQTGLTHTYAGVIADGAAGMSLTMAGPGAQVLTGNSTFTGPTILNQGTLQAGTATLVGRLTGTSGFVFNGGTLQINRSTGANIDALSDSAPITSNGGTLAIRSQDAGGANATENIGVATLNQGQMNFNWMNGASSGARVILAGLTLNSSPTTAGQTAAVTFSGSLAFTGRWGVTGSGTMPAGQIIGPWATTGLAGGIAAQTDYAVYNVDFVAPAGIAASTEDTWTSGANVTLSGATALTGTRALNSLRYSGNAQTLDLAGNLLQTHGVLNGGTGLLTIGGSGALTTPSGGGNLFLTPGNNAITVSAPLNDNSGPVTVVKSGSNTLTLGSTASTYSGGTVINAGTVAISNNANLGAAGTDLLFNGNGTLLSTVDSTLVDLGSRSLVLNNGATATISGTSRGNMTIGGAVTGSGGITAGGGLFWQKLRLDSTANTFTGPITVASTATTDTPSGNVSWVFSLNSIHDAPGAGNIQLLGGSNTGVEYGAGAIAPLVLNHRQIIVGNSNGVVLNNAGAQPVTINTDIGFSGTGARSLVFGYGNAGRAGSGVSTFAGKLTDNAGGAFTPAFGGGHWALTGANTYTGKTTVNGGTLSFNSIRNAGGNVANALGTPAKGAASVIDLAPNATLRYTGSGHGSDRVINLNGTGNGTYRLEASGTGTLALTAGMSSAATSGTVTFRLEGTGSGEIGLIRNGVTATALRKSGTGAWTLTGANTHTGATTVEAGTLVVNGDQTAATGTLTVAADATLGGRGTLGGNTTVAANGKLEFQITTPAASHDRLDLAAGKTFTFSGDSVLTIASTADAAPGAYTLVRAPGGIAGPAPTTLNLPSGWSATVSIVGGTELVLDVTSTGATVNYADWQAANGTAQPVDGDHDGDGVTNGIEWFVHGPNASSGADSSPGVFSNAGGLMVVWTKHPGFNGNFAVESADTPSGPWSPETIGDRVTVVGNEIRFTFATPLPARKYAQLKITGP